MNYISCGLLIFAAHFNVLVIAGRSYCPSNEWYHVNCSCFIVKNSTEGLNWSNAEQRCSRMGNDATLAGIKSQYQNRILGQHLSHKESWIGLRSEGNSTLLLPNRKDTTFHPGVEERYNQSTCIASRLTKIWRAGDCGVRRRYICSRDLVGDKSCPSGWMTYLKSCYHLSTESLIYTEAKDKCIAMNNSKLVEISSKQEYEFLRKQFRKGNEIIQVWFGLHKNANASNYQYSDGSKPNFNDLDVKFIPQTKSSEMCCVSMELAETSVKWEAKNCLVTLKSYVCETKITGLDFKIDVTNENETSAKISWSTQPRECLSSNGKIYKLEIYEGTTLKHSIRINQSESYQIFGGFEPETEFQIKVLGDEQTVAVKNFSTSEIENPLRVLTKISSHEIHAREGDTVNLLCAVRGEPPINFSWLKNMNKLESYVETEHPLRSSILSVQLNNQTSFGKYICHIQDQFGNKTHAVQVIPLSKDDSESNWFVIVIVVLGVAVAILIVIIAYLIRSIKHLKRRLKETKKTNSVTLKKVSREGLTFDDPQPSPGKSSNEGRYVSPEEENEQYTALSRNGNEEESFYSPLNDAPLYVNASEYK